MLTGTALLHVFNQILEDFTSDSNWDILYAGGESAGNSDVAAHQSEGIDDSDLHFYLVLCITQCQHLAICCPVYVSAGRGLLGMALQVGALSIDDALALATPLQSCSIHQNAAAPRGDFGDFVIDFNLAAKVPEEAKVKAVATRLDEMILLSNVTQNGDFYSL
jgi:hypothetical protein